MGVIIIGRFFLQKKVKHTPTKLDVFTYQYSCGTQYIFILYDYDLNTIIRASLKNQTAEEITKAWGSCHKRLIKNGHKVNLDILDNKISSTMKHAFEQNKVEFQLVTPDQHRRNTTKHGICTFKDHLLAGLVTCDPSFPIREWDRILNQC